MSNKNATNMRVLVEYVDGRGKQAFKSMLVRTVNDMDWAVKDTVTSIVSNGGVIFPPIDEVYVFIPLKSICRIDFEKIEST